MRLGKNSARTALFALQPAGGFFHPYCTAQGQG